MSNASCGRNVSLNADVLYPGLLLDMSPPVSQLR